MTYEGKVWRVDYQRGHEISSVIVLADTLDAAQGMAWQEIGEAEIIGFYVMTGIRGAVYEVKK